MLTFDTSSLDHLDILQAREDVAADAEANLDTVFDALLDVEWVLLELSELLFRLLQVDRDASAWSCC